MSYSFSGPTFGSIVPAIAGAAFIGMAYQAVAETRVSPAYILIIKEFAEYALYNLGTSFIGTHRSRAKLYAATNLLVNVVALVALHKYNIIGFTGSAFFISLMAIELFCKALDFTKFSEKTPGHSVQV